jgi:cytochrome c oxidase subunit 5a
VLKLKLTILITSSRDYPGTGWDCNHKFKFVLTTSPAVMRSQILSTVLRAAVRPSLTNGRTAPALIRPSSSHAQETFESFSDRYVKFFQNAEDLFELQRGLNNCFAHDLVPSPAVVEAAVRAARRVNDYSTAVRVFEGIREKVENKQQYQAYLEELKGLREELGNLCIFSSRLWLYSHLPVGLTTKEELYQTS